MNPDEKPPRHTTPLPRPRSAIEEDARRARIRGILIGAAVVVLMLLALLAFMPTTNPK